jgi:hypothetical protein
VEASIGREEKESSNLRESEKNVRNTTTLSTILRMKEGVW